MCYHYSYMDSNHDSQHEKPLLLFYYNTNDLHSEITPLIKIIDNIFIDLSAPSNISSWWNFGFLLGICLILQTLTGLFLADTLYTRYDNHLLISHTYLLRYILWVNYPIHNANEASIFFICLFIHVGCGLYCGSYNLLETWNIGVILLYRHSYSTYRLRTALRANTILRSKQQ